MEWAQRAGDLQSLREFLGTIPLTESATWATVAGDLSGVLAAGAMATTGEESRALAEASDALAASARVRPAEQVPRPEGMPDTVDLARFIAAAGKGNGAEWLIVWAQLRNDARAVHAAHVAVSDAQRAREIVDAMQGRIAELTAPVRQAAPAAGEGSRAPAAGRQPAGASSSDAGGGEESSAGAAEGEDRAAEGAAKLARAGGAAPRAPAQPAIPPRVAIDRDAIPKRPPQVARPVQEQEAARLGR